ncbi:hypothetical protein [Selenomonas sp. AE3005]|uniref:hypothetical protein n=1 Tax=Selenomonas sp. AE3005 TaxID=1485543 RepID=UPI0025EAD98D|nr:hypothetical protein [Selenomonas sp. AE3005]
MKTEDLRKLKALLMEYQSEKCKIYNDGGCHKLILKNGDIEPCPAFAVEYDSEGGIVGGACAIDWLRDDLRCDDGKSAKR